MMKRTSSRRREEQGGFALLMIFVMAAGIALMLYSQLPRTAFESVRGKEELLVDHAHEYERAIQLYVAQFHAYPASIDDLEKANNKRFLRRKFKDPFTGKDDWRIVHVDNMGKLTDSLIEKKEEKKPNQNTFITEMAGIGQTPTDLDAGGVNVALRKRPSEGNATGDNGGPPPLPAPSSAPPPTPQAVPNPSANQSQYPSQTQGQNPTQNQAGFNPSQPNGMSAGGALPAPQNPQTVQQIYPNGVPQYPGQVNSGVFPSGANSGLPQLRQNPTQAPSAAQQYSGTIVAGQSIGASTPVSQPAAPPQVGGQFQQGNFGNSIPPTYGNNVATQSGRAGFSSGINNGTPQAALNAIQQALTQPNGANMPMNMGPGMQIRGGIAGIAPKGHDGPSIKIISEQTNYKKWEFIYDMRKDNRMQQALGQARAQLPNQIPGPNSSNGLSSGPASGFSSQSSFGSTTGVGSQTGIGSQSGFGAQTGVSAQTGAQRGFSAPIGATGQSGYGTQPNYGAQPSYGTSTGIVAQPGLGSTGIVAQPGLGSQPSVGSQPAQGSQVTQGSQPTQSSQPAQGTQPNQGSQNGASGQQPGVNQQPGAGQPGTTTPAPAPVPPAPTQP